MALRSSARSPGFRPNSGAAAGRRACRSRSRTAPRSLLRGIEIVVEVHAGQRIADRAGLEAGVDLACRLGHAVAGRDAEDVPQAPERHAVVAGVQGRALAVDGNPTQRLADQPGDLGDLIVLLL